MPDRAKLSSDAATYTYEQVDQAAKAAGLIVMGLFGLTSFGLRYTPW